MYIVKAPGWKPILETSNLDEAINTAKKYRVGGYPETKVVRKSDKKVIYP